MNQDVEAKRELYMSEHTEYESILEGRAELPQKRQHDSDDEDDTIGSSEKRPKK
jgi:hypothetical protein